jgi:gliding motility-associated-like protein
MANVQHNLIRAIRRALLMVVLGILGTQSWGQCDGNVPSLTVDLSSSPSATYLSPSVVRNGYCCGVSGNDRCLEFVITLHPDAQGINFAVCAGAVPGGALYYQINCGPIMAVGTPICLNGQGPHILTFCKPGNNDNQYCITSIPAPSAGPPITLNEGCTGTLTTSGFAPGSVQWTSIFPGPMGTYNNYLGCPTCPNTSVTGQAGYPAYVDYRVCGLALSPCSQNTFCDTVRVTFNSTLLVSISPQNPTVCFGAAGTTITANVSGGTPPYNLLWNNGTTTAGNFVGVGTHSVLVTDGSNCPGTSASIVVTQFSMPIMANAGADIVLCGNVTVAQLNGSVTGVTTGQWSGGAGQFSPTTSTLNATYQPTAAEIAAGFVDLVLSTTNNGTCPGHQDTVRVFFDPGVQNGLVTAVNASCNGVANGSASFSPANPTYSYVWSNGQTGATATGLAAGGYTVTVSTALGCTASFPVTITQPAALAIASMNVVNESCAGMGNGSATVIVSGGTVPYAYTWSVPGSGPSITAGAGTYQVSITDANGCAAVQSTAQILATGQPNAANAGSDVVACAGAYPVAMQGTVTNATGGVWSGGGGTFTGTGLGVGYTPSAAEIQAGSATLTLTTTGNTSCPPASDQVTILLSNAFLNASLTTSQVICAGAANGSVTYTPALPGLTYQWSGFPQVGGPVLAGLPAGAYTVLVTDVLGCSASFTATLADPAPMAVASTTVLPPTCSGYTNGSAQVSISGGLPPYAYLWSASAGAQQAAQANGLSSGAHGLTVTDANGCVLQTSVSLNTPPPVALEAMVPDTVCVNAPVVLTATASGGTGTHTITWNGLGTGSTLVHSFGSSQTVTVTVTDADNCPGPVLTFPVLVLDLPSAQLTTYGDTTVCPGGQTYVGASLTGYPGPYTLQWPSLSLTGSGPFLLPVTATTTIPVQVTDQCGNSLAGGIQLTLETPPTINLPPLIAQGCAPLTVNFPTNLTNQPVTYLWNLGNGTVSQQPAPVVVYPAGSYTVSLTVSTPLGCTATATNTGQVVSLPPPQVSITASPWTTDIDHATIDFTAQTSTNITSTWWNFGDGGSSMAVNPSHTYGDVGSFEVTLNVQDVNGCIGIGTTQVLITPNYDITVPNIFTPGDNGGGSGTYNPLDLSNDIFYPFVRFVKDFRMRVFNRWGELIFESNELSRGWDGYYRGQMSPQDVYVYQLYVRFVDGKEKHQLGDITLMR